MAREFFTSRTKTKKFPRHVFQSMEIGNYGT
ncbi:DUF1661 domain-containing protein [Porphyromonas gingivalis]|nr:DUF1661 domain-containing protein [Porphyromonas gingivalis]